MLNDRRRPEPDELDPVTWDMLNEGLELTAVDHLSAIDDLHAQTRLAARIFASADVLLCPTLNVLPPPPGALSASRGTVDAFFEVEFASTGATAVANAAGWAAITLPLGEVEGLPVGVQMMVLPVSAEKCRWMAIEFCRSTWELDERLIRG
jgi:amidase